MVLIKVYWHHRHGWSVDFVLESGGLYASIRVIDDRFLTTRFCSRFPPFHLSVA